VPITQIADVSSASGRGAAGPTNTPTNGPADGNFLENGAKAKTIVGAAAKVRAATTNNKGLMLQRPSAGGKFLWASAREDERCWSDVFSGEVSSARPGYVYTQLY
jgi:hypothetical protein